jgi:hypothetical protein
MIMQIETQKTELPTKRKTTPPEVIANVARVVTKSVDRITGDRSDCPLLVAIATVEALKQHAIRSQIMFGPCAWVEVLQDQSVVWAGCWDGNYSFWVVTEFQETVDLNVSVAFRKKSHSPLHVAPLYSPPMLWSNEVPIFYKYIPEGVAEIELNDEFEKKRYEAVHSEVIEKCGPHVLNQEQNFPNEPMIMNGHQLLDDSSKTFKLFERVIAVRGIDRCPLSLN